MRRASGGLRTDLEPRLTALEHANPEWRQWLALLGELCAVLDERAESGAVDVVAPARARSDDAALLDGATLRVAEASAQELVQRLAAAAARGGAPLASYRPSPQDALRLLEAVIRHDRPGVARLAAAAQVDAGAFAVVGQAAAVPLLAACTRALAERVPPHWPHGHCPICAAWPVIAELRGLDRSRHLRCGRCGGDWQISWLRCPYCGESEHRRLGSLVPDSARDTRKIETCDSCHGYVKTVTTLQAIPLMELLVRDLETVELDLVAVDRGFLRPDGPGRALDVQLLARQS